jgi:hypothetical protein
MIDMGDDGNVANIFSSHIFVSCFRFRVSGFGFRVSGFRFPVSG